MPNLFDVVIMNVEGIISYRGTKYCVCVSVSENKYLFINSSSRRMYDDFQIEASDYPFLNDLNRFVACSRIYFIEPSRAIRTVGRLNFADAGKVVAKIKKSWTVLKKDKDSILPGLEDCLLNDIMF